MFKYKVVKSGIGGEDGHVGIIIESSEKKVVGKELSGSFYVKEAPKEFLKGMQYFCNITLKEVK